MISAITLEKEDTWDMTSGNTDITDILSGVVIVWKREFPAFPS